MSDGFSCPTTTNNPLSEHIDACQLIDNEIDLELGKLPIGWNISDTQNETVFITDYVANGSFASLAENVTYNHEPDFAVLIRLTDFNNSFNGNFVYVNEHSYNFLRKSKLYGGEIIISNVGAYSGTVFFAPKLNRPMTLGPNSIMMNFINGNEFYYYWFRSPIGKFLLEGIISGSAQPKFNKTLFRKLKVPVPPLPEQKAIAAVLSSLDDKIDLLHRQNKTLEAMAETLFRQWFIEEAKEDWEKNTFEKWISNTFGGDWGKEFPDKDYIVPAYCIRGTDIADLQDGLAKKTPIRYITERKFGIVEPQNGDIIFEISGGTENQSTGRSIYIDKNIKSLFSYPLVFSNFCRLLRPKNEKFTYFIFLYLQYLYKQDEFFNLENGSSGIKNLNYKALLFELLFTMPNENRVLDFNGEVSSLFNKINKNKSQIQTLEKLRDNLLPKLMSGEVRVSYEQQDAA